MKHSNILVLIAAFSGILALVAGGCSSSRNAGKDSELVWPSPPDEPRVKYVRTLQSDKDYESGLGAITRALAGNSTGISLQNPFDVCADGRGHIWVSDASLGLILFDDVKKEMSLVGDSSDVPLKDVRGVACGDTMVFAGLASSGQVVALTRGGRNLYSIGKRGQFTNPVDVVFDSVKHHVIVVDNKLHRVFVYSEKGDSLFSFGGRGSDDGLFNFPESAALDTAGNFYVVDALNFRVEIFDSTGKFLRKFGEHGDAWGMFGHPKGITLDPNGNIYVSDSYFHNIQIFNQQGELLLFIGKNSYANDGFQDPVSLAIDQSKKLYVTDQLNRRVQIFQLLKGD